MGRDPAVAHASNVRAHGTGRASGETQLDTQHAQRPPCREHAPCGRCDQGAARGRSPPAALGCSAWRGTARLARLGSLHISRPKCSSIAVHGAIDYEDRRERRNGARTRCSLIFDRRELAAAA